MTTTAIAPSDMSMEDIQKEAQTLIEKLQYEFDEIDWDVEKTRASLGFINWDLCILGHINLTQ